MSSTINELYRKYREEARTVFIGTTTVSVLLLGNYARRYFKAIRKRLQELQDNSRLMNSGMIRLDPANRPKHQMQILELNPEFVAAHKDAPMISMGAYLSSLRPVIIPQGTVLSNWMQKELETVLALVLLKRLGPSWGKTALPFLGLGSVQSRVQDAALFVANWWSSHFTGAAKTVYKKNPISSDSGVLPVTLSGLVEPANTHGQARGLGMKETPLHYMGAVGEISQHPDFGADHEGSSGEPLLPNPFIVSEHFEKALRGMEKLIEIRDGEYDPDDRALSEPKPVNEKLLPGLHLGWGDSVSKT
jgi:hypothetical protein